MFEHEIVLSSQPSTAIHHAYPSHVTFCRSKDKTEAVVWQVFLAAGQALSDFSPQMAVVSVLPTWRNPKGLLALTPQQPIYASALPEEWRWQPELSKTSVWKKCLSKLRSCCLAISVQMYTCFCSNSNEPFSTGAFKCTGFRAEWNLTMIQLFLTLHTVRSGLQNSQGFTALWSKSIKISPLLKFYSSTANGC